MLFSTFLTLVLVPVVYSYLARFTKVEAVPGEAELVDGEKEAPKHGGEPVPAMASRAGVE
jgi:hypothetical protein